MTTKNHGVASPSPRQIKQMCRQIQAAWSAKELARRIVVHRQPWLPGLVLAIDPGRRPAAPQ
jgi:hypothetical protein